MMNEGEESCKGETPPEVTDVSGRIPEAWSNLVDEIGSVEPSSRRASELQARLQVWLLFAHLRSQQQESQAAERRANDARAQADAHARAAQRNADGAKSQAKVLSLATWVLAAATLGLFVATVVLAINS